ncbi:MAG TPA: CRISPR-associated helicase Cas3', partial [Ignavibacteria bacterium]|nr:CRISPR-associated helicase Cas3' [Ignavibacteria bacterium]
MSKKNNFLNFFTKLTDFAPYEFQLNTFSLFIDGKSNIIQAPTGSGKTWGALAPFIFCWKEWKDGRQNREDYPRKLIYSLPLRTLANSLFNEVLNKITEKFPELDIKIKLQTGEFPNDLFFEGDIIFTTIDQTLSNVLGIPLSLPKKLANINAGAIISSYLVFDEFHLLDPKASLKTTIILLDALKKISPFCLMTATLSNNFLDKSSQLLNAKITKVNREDYNSFAFVKNITRRNININKETLTIEKIIREHKQKTIVICNTVDRCVNIFKELLVKKDNEEIKSELICIHSRFFQEDRKRKEKRILELFGQQSNADVILVSTQVIEVGLDISCDTMHTEISPINSLVQRAGRCARWQGNGELFIYDVPERKYLPYKKELSENTFKTLIKYENSNLDFYLSQEIIEKVLTEYERNIFDEIQNDSINTWQNIKDSWKTGEQAYVRTLIRDIRSINVVLLPKGFKTNSLYIFESISMNPYSLKKEIEDILDTYESEQPIIVMKLEEPNFDFEKTKELNQLEPSDIYLENIVALNTNEVGYNPKYGLDFSLSNNFQSKEKERKKKY